MKERWEYWIALATGLMIVIERHKQAPLTARFLIAGISGGFGHIATPEVAAMTGRSEEITVMILTALGYLIMDQMAALVADRKTVLELMKSVLGRRGR